jgi:PKD repeat protein
MRSRPTPRVGALAGLALFAVLAVSACAPPPAPHPTTTTTTTTSTVPAGPVAAASATPTAPGYFGLPVAFSSGGSSAPAGHSITSYLWDFGDGFSATTASPTHTYREPGPYTVTLTVTDDLTDTATATTTVAQPAPVGDVAISSNPVVIPSNPGTANVKVWWNGQAPSTLIFVNVCKKSVADPTFNVAVDCGFLQEVTPNGTTSGSGVTDVEVFRGADPGEEPWGIFAASDTAPAGVTKYTTGYIRVTNDVRSNNLDSREIPFTVAAS